MTRSEFTSDLKKCNQCEQWFPISLEYFPPSKDSHHGLRPVCRECNKKRYARRYARKRDELLQWAKEKREANIEIFRERDKRRYWNNPDKENARHKAYRAANPEAARETNRKQRERKKLLGLTYPISNRAKSATRRARKKAAEGKYTRKDIELQFKAQKGKCWHCGASIVDYFEADHLIPLAKGGTNNPNNIVLSCQPCNRSKGDKLPQEWNGRLF